MKEFLEGDFFQADFDRVMALLEERSDKAFAEIDKKSEAMEKHADEKITEFDNKIAATNQTLATLEKKSMILSKHLRIWMFLISKKVPQT